VSHSAKDLPSVTLGKGHSPAILSANRSLPSAFFRALGKAFTERQGRHSANEINRDGVWGRDGVFAECLRRRARQRLGSLPRAGSVALGKEAIFAESRSAALGKD
jgi:hypothetical protein